MTDLGVTGDTILTQYEVESEIMRLSGLAETVTKELSIRAIADADARVSYKIAEAQAKLKAKDAGGPRRTVQDIEAVAIIETQDDFRAWAIAEARFKAAQEAGRNYRAQLDALRSVNANLRAQVSG